MDWQQQQQQQRRQQRQLDCQRVVEKKMGLLLLPSNLKSETKK
jgi:hypothetical protein